MIFYERCQSNILMCDTNGQNLKYMSKVTQNEQMIVKKYPKSNGVVGGSILSCEILSLPNEENLLGGYSVLFQVSKSKFGYKSYKRSK